MKKLALTLNEIWPAKLFAPNKSQFELIKAVGTISLEGVLAFLLTSANGVGKSTVVAQIIINLIYGNISMFRDITSDLDPDTVIPGFFNFPLFENYPEAWPKRIWWISNSEAIKTAFTSHLMPWLPQDTDNAIADYELGYEKAKDGKPYVSKVTWPDKGWEMSFKTQEQDIKTFESENVGIIVCDEPPSEAIFDASISRLRMGGILLLPGTPVVGSDAGWFLHRIIESDDLYTDETKGLYWWGTAGAYENTTEPVNGTWDLGLFGKHPIGNIDRLFLDRQVKAWRNTDHLEARVYGRISGMSGLILPTYDRDIHRTNVVNVQAPASYMWRMVIDPHDRRPPYVGWLRLGADGQQAFTKEWPETRSEEFGDTLYADIKSTTMTWGDQMELWIQIEKDLRIAPARIQRIIDPNYGNRRLGDVGILLHEYLSKLAREKDYPMSFITNANNDIRLGHTAVREQLEINTMGYPGIVFDLSCENMDTSLRRYAWAEFTGKNASERRGLSDKPAEKYKDPIDILRYNAMIPWTYEAPKGVESDTQRQDYRRKQVTPRPTGTY